MTEYLEQHFKDLDKEIKEHFKDIDVHIKAIETKSDSTFPQVQFASEFDPEPLAHEAATEGRSKKLKKLVKGGKLAKAWSETESFELCKTVGRNGVRRSTASSNVSTFLKMKDLSTCDPTKEVAVFEPGSDGTYNIACCAKDGLHCSGCMELSEDKGSCELCSGGFTDSSGTCEACLDLPGWETIDGINCYDLVVTSCDDEKVRGQGGLGSYIGPYLQDTEKYLEMKSTKSATGKESFLLNQLQLVLQFCSLFGRFGRFGCVSYPTMASTLWSSSYIPTSVVHRNPSCARQEKYMKMLTQRQINDVRLLCCVAPEKDTKC